MRILFAFVFFSLISYNPSYAGDEATQEVDVNVVTAIDVSGSVGLGGEGFQFAAIARAIEHPDFLQAIARGYRKRIGFSVMTWSSKGGFSKVIDWTSISSEQQSKGIARQLRHASPRTQYRYGRLAPNLPKRPWRRYLSTDISGALNLALDWLEEAPFPSARSVINLCTNGTDNVAEGPELARMRAIESNTTVNGLIIGDDPQVTAYFKDHVQTGTRSFVVEARQHDDILDAMLRKFLLDLVMAPDPAGHDRQAWSQQ
ncbi:MAG: DUF1194 domain-containing protein [Alphaproteobacteria bacterium]